MKDKVLSEEGHRQQLKLKELQALAERLGCTLPQLAIGTAGAGSKVRQQQLDPGGPDRCSAPPQPGA